MKRTALGLVGILLLGMVAGAWAQGDPAKEIAELGKKRVEAALKGDIDTFLGDRADNVVITTARAGFRMEGKKAVRAFLLGLWQQYPERRSLTPQRIYTALLGRNAVGAQRHP